jgi:hypothetical protein
VTKCRLSETAESVKFVKQNKKYSKYCTFFPVVRLTTQKRRARTTESLNNVKNVKMWKLKFYYDKLTRKSRKFVYRFSNNEKVMIDAASESFNFKFFDTIKLM